MQPERPGDIAEFNVYVWGLVNATVCTSLPLEEATDRLNREMPTGVYPWYPAPEPTFAGGEPQPGPCERSTDHRHYLFHC